MKTIFTLFFLCVLNIILTSTPAVVSATEVVPQAYTSTVGTAGFLGPLANTPRTYQLLIHDSLLNGFEGQNLTAISFRSLTSNTIPPWPTVDATFSSYRIYLSESVAPANRSLAFFANNVVGPQTQVRGGSLFIPANSYDTTGSPTPFGPEITFDTPYLYTGGHLLIEIRQSGNPTSRTVDALSTSTSGYGTLFSACWKSGDTATFNALNGNFSIIKLSSSPSSSLKLDLRAFIEGLVDPATITMISDTAKVYLRNDFAPYAIVDSAVSVLDANGDGSYTFFNAVNGVNYYIVVDQRNSIDTWSSTGVSFTAGALSYDFTSSQSSAFGNNLKFLSPPLGRGIGAWTIYSGDVNKDGFIDLTDLIQTFNDAANFVTGYVVTDINGDLEVNLLDMLLIYNNAVIFIKEERPL